MERQHALLARVAAAVARHPDWGLPSVAALVERAQEMSAYDFYRHLRDRLKRMTVAERRGHQQRLMSDFGLDTATLTADYLNVEQLIELDAHPLIEIGAHTVSHPDLRYANDTELAYELSHSRARLEEWLGHPVTTMAYPFGDTDGRVHQACAKAGYRRAYLTETPNWRCRVPFYRRLDLPRADLAWETKRMRERDRKLAQRAAG